MYIVYYILERLARINTIRQIYICNKTISPVNVRCDLEQTVNKDFISVFVSSGISKTYVKNPTKFDHRKPYFSHNFDISIVKSLVA